MDITAVICEYNPFHMGHKYQFDLLRRMYPDTSIISVMSPNFVQRGQPALFDKFVRGECAVRCGADIAVSMPQVFSLMSAEGFAECGVKLASKLGAEYLSFGVEDDDIEGLKKIATVLISTEFEIELKKELKLNPSLSYPKIRQAVLERFVGEELSRLISTPNNILAVEYIKAVFRYAPEIKFRPIKRLGNAHSDASSEGVVLSSTAIRDIIEKGGNWKSKVPEKTLPVISSSPMLNKQKYDNFIWSVLSVSEYESILKATGNKELADTIYAALKKHGDYPSFCSSVARKKFTQTKIDRALVNTMLKIGFDEFIHCDPEYVFLLALNSRGRQIAAMAKKQNVILLSRPSEIKRINNSDFTTQMEKEKVADIIWSKCLDIPMGEKYFIDKTPFISEDSL